MANGYTLSAPWVLATIREGVVARASRDARSDSKRNVAPQVAYQVSQHCHLALVAAALLAEAWVLSDQETFFRSLH